MPRILEERVLRHRAMSMQIQEAASTCGTPDARLVARAIHYLGVTIAMAADVLTQVLAEATPPERRRQSILTDREEGEDPLNPQS